MTSVLTARRPCCAEPDARRALTGTRVGSDRLDGGQGGRGPTCAGTGGGTALGSGRSGRDEPVLLAELLHQGMVPRIVHKALQDVRGPLGQGSCGQTAYEGCEGLLATVWGQAERGDLGAVRASLRRRRVQAAWAVRPTCPGSAELHELWSIDGGDLRRRLPPCRLRPARSLQAVICVWSMRCTRSDRVGLGFEEVLIDAA